MILYAEFYWCHITLYSAFFGIPKWDYLLYHSSMVWLHIFVYANTTHRLYWHANIVTSTPAYLHKQLTLNYLTHTSIQIHTLAQECRQKTMLQKKYTNLMCMHCIYIYIYTRTQYIRCIYIYITLYMRICRYAMYIYIYITNRS